MVDRILQFFRRLWRQPALLLTPEMEVPDLPAPRRRRNSDRTAAKDAEEGGRWYYFADLLEKLSEFFKVMRAIRSRYPDNYRTFSKIGAHIITSGDAYLFSIIKLNELWRHGQRPALAMVYLHSELNGDPKDCPVQAVYIRKTNWHPSVAPRKREFYLCGAVFKVDGKPVAFEWFIDVDDAGVSHVLKMKTGRYQYFKGHGDYVRHSDWAYPDLYCPEADPQKDAYKGMTPEQVSIEKARSVFAIAANCSIDAQSDMQVRVTNGREAAMFAIDMLRTPYFFKDRDLATTQNGRRKKIFHIVRTHERELKNGSTVPVRSHFRGERKFGWNGYQVSISMPGKHHAALYEFDGAEHIDDRKNPNYPKAKMLDADEAAGHIAGHLAS